MVHSFTFTNGAPSSRLFVGLIQPFNSSQLLFSLSGIVITAAILLVFTQCHCSPIQLVHTSQCSQLPSLLSACLVSLQVDPFNSSKVSPICPHRPPPLYATLILIINLLLLLDFCLFNYSLPFLLSISWLCSLQLYSFKAFRSPKPLDI